MKKKIFILALALLLTMAFALAINGETTEAETVKAETAEAVSTTVTVASASGIGVVVLTVVIFFITNIKKILKGLVSIATAFTTIFGKNGKVENIPTIIDGLKNEFKELENSFKETLKAEQERYAELEAEYKKMHAETNEYKQAFAIFCLYANNINPYVKNEIYRLVKGEVPFKEDIQETVKEIDEIVKQAMESEVKEATPCLDSVTGE